MLSLRVTTVLSIAQHNSLMQSSEALLLSQNILVEISHLSLEIDLMQSSEALLLSQNILVEISHLSLEICFCSLHISW